MTNKKLTGERINDETLSAWKSEAVISLGETPEDIPEYSHHQAILALVTELQEYRKAAGTSGDFLSRMRDELQQLRARAKGLHSFVGTPSFKVLSDSSRAAIIRQMDVMAEYIEILHHRIRLAESDNH